MRQFFQRAVEAVECAPWLTRERLLRWGTAYALASIGLLAFDVIIHPTNGVTTGRDFSEFWSNTVMALTGHPEAAYLAGPHHTLDQSLTYPPIMMLICAPFAHLPYSVALLAWVALGVMLFAWSLSRLVGWPMAALATIGTPAAFWNLLSGQDGYFTAVLLVWGMTLVERRPMAAGVLFGTVCYKPQFAVLLPIALAAGKHWRALIAAALWAAFLSGVSVILFGPKAWIAFFGRLEMQRRLMEVADLSWPRMPTMFAMVRLSGGSLAAAYAAQAVSAVAAAATIVALWRSRCSVGIKAAGLAVALFLATPHAWDYDTVVLVFAAAWLARDAIKTGFRPWEKAAVLALLTLPALALGPAKLLGLQPAPILLWLILVILLRRGLALSSREAAASRPRGPVSDAA